MKYWLPLKSMVFSAQPLNALNIIEVNAILCHLMLHTKAGVGNVLPTAYQLNSLFGSLEQSGNQRWYGTKTSKKGSPWIVNSPPSTEDLIIGIVQENWMEKLSAFMEGLLGHSAKFYIEEIKRCGQITVYVKPEHAALMELYVKKVVFEGDDSIAVTLNHEPFGSNPTVNSITFHNKAGDEAGVSREDKPRGTTMISETVKPMVSSKAEEPVRRVDAHTDEYKIMQGIQSARRAYALALLMNDLGLTDSELQELKLAAETAIGIRKSMSHEVSSASVAQTKEAPIEAAGQSSPEVETSVEAVVDQSQLEGELALRILKNVRQKNEILRLVFYADEVLMSDLKRAVADLEKAGWFMFFWLDKREDKWIIKAVNTSLWDVHKIPAPHSGKFEQLTKNGGLQIGTLPGTKIKVVVTKKVVDADPVAA